MARHRCAEALLSAVGDLKKYAPEFHSAVADCLGLNKLTADLEQAGAQPVASYEAGDSFGELALMYSCARAATVQCVQQGVRISCRSLTRMPLLRPTRTPLPPLVTGAQRARADVTLTLARCTRLVVIDRQPEADARGGGGRMRRRSAWWACRTAEASRSSARLSVRGLGGVERIETARAALSKEMQTRALVGRQCLLAVVLPEVERCFQ